MACPGLGHDGEKIMERMKQVIHDLLEEQDAPSRAARITRSFLIALIVLNVIAYMLETVPSVTEAERHFLLMFEYFSVGVFTVEYVLRLWVSTHCQERNQPLTCRLRCMFRPLMLIDLLAILPFYMPLLIPMDLIFLRTMRLLRLARVLKLGRYSDAMRLFGLVVKSKREQLTVVCFILGILLVVASSLMHHFEYEAQPGAFESIPATMWWAIITLTTVGYGDAYPVTAMGKVMASIIAMLGIGMFALPAGILSAGFLEAPGAVLKREAARKDRFEGASGKNSETSSVCPHCGGKLD